MNHIFSAYGMFEQIGHSLGGALAELDALYLTLNLPSNISIKAVTYGTPRVGNHAFARFYDKNVRCYFQTSFMCILFMNKII
jgi:predicted lipase